MIIKPSELDRGTELPVTAVPDVSSWSENYCFDGYDHEADFGCWIHLGRWPGKPHIWREQLLLYLPDGDHLITRSYGNQAVENGVGGALLKLRCEEPGQRWSLRYEGPARRASLEGMMGDPHGHLSEGPFVTVDFQMEFNAIKPAWDLGDMAGENWASFHYEQHGRLTGVINYQTADGGKRTVEFAGSGYRDHSRGVRDLSNFGGFYWNHCVFPSGRGFSVVHSYKWEDGVRSVGVERAVIYDGNNIVPAQLVSGVPLLTDKNLPPENYKLVFDSELGKMEVNARLLRTIPASSDKHNNQFDGIVSRKHGVLYCFEQATEYRWEDQIGYGWTERSEHV